MGSCRKGHDGAECVHWFRMAQFVRRMGFHTDKPMAMFRPTDVEVATSQPEAEAARYVPATVVDRIDLYYMMKYFVRLDDGLVRAPLHDV